MKTLKIVYHEDLYDLSIGTEVFRFYREFLGRNTSKITIKEMIDNEVFLYDQLQDLYFHVRSSNTITIRNREGKRIVYYTGHNCSAEFPVVRSCSYSGHAYFRDDHEWIEMHDGDYALLEFKDDLYEYGGMYFATESQREAYIDRHVRFISDYHSSRSVFYSFDDLKPEPFKVGFEIEKEDMQVRKSLTLDAFRNITNNFWRKEKDASLNSGSGFELISPIMDFNVKHIIKYINENKTLVDHINAGYSDACGGHINISEDDTSGLELFEKISGYIPILYAMYRYRLGNSYSVGEKKDQLKQGRRSALCVKSDRIEVRIFPAVRNIDNLEFRLRLLRFMLANFTSDTRTAVQNLRKETGLFSGIYNREALASMFRRAEVYSIDFDFSDKENGDISMLA